uniref:G domain-containing protein n=1 Tax=Steinernema glaseri TaxID=37863 RepID=A0A1I7YJ34_9BILA
MPRITPQHINGTHKATDVVVFQRSQNGNNGPVVEKTNHTAMEPVNLHGKCAAQKPANLVFKSNLSEISLPQRRSDIRNNFKENGIRMDNRPPLPIKPDFKRVILPSAVPLKPECDSTAEPTTIVLLGETGVGKSTLVNGIYNYLKFDSLEEAESYDDLCYLIPAQFHYGDETVRIGDDLNENLNTTGASVTQRPKAYQFSVGDKKYRIIDVPGIGDSRGAEQDQKNFNMIIEEINKYEKIHAFCILMPSEGARMTVAMKYCIHELLSNLHKDASKNIVFCFTKTRSTFYKNGGSYDLLAQYMTKLKEKKGIDIPLNRNTMYFFDNEAFRFLCIQKQFASLDAQRADVLKSWEISKENASRLLMYVSSLPPHETRHMAQLSEAKRTVMEMIRLSAQLRKKMNDSPSYQVQRRKLEEICSKSSAFLRQNALGVRNDDYEEYLKAAIDTEEKESMFGESSERLSELRRSLQSYEEQVQLLEDSSDISDSITQEHIYELRDQLKQLAEEFNIEEDGLRKKSATSTV